LAGTVTFRAVPHSYVASSSKVIGDMLELIEDAHVVLPNVSDPEARAQLEQAIAHANTCGGDARAARAAGEALSKAIEEATTMVPPPISPEMEKLSLVLAIAGAMSEYGGEWVNLLPKVTTPPLRDALLSESQLLTTLRTAMVDGRQIEARNDITFAERAAERIDSLMHASDLLFPLTYARIVSEYTAESGHKRGPGGLLSQLEWDRIRQTPGVKDQNPVVSGSSGTQEQHARDIGALLEQMKVTIISNPALFHAQYQRVMQLVDAFYSSQA
ncbi:MAG TPA: hypothetical protein VJN88_13660, partial [Ktedonobacterales bacterium]|nr:hypothetical protein [Ktedonobacterales bacterium]